MKWLRRGGLPLVTGLALLLLVLPLLLRLYAGAPITPGSESYVYLQEPADSLYTVLLGLFVTLGIPWVLPVLLALLFLSVLHTYLVRKTRNKTVPVLALLILVVSPGLSVLGTHYTPELFGLTFVLLALLARRRALLSCLLFVLGCVTAPIPAVAVLVYLLLSSTKKREFVRYVILTVIVGVWFVLFGFPSLNFHGALPVFELGVAGGISVFLIIMAAYTFTAGQRRLFVPAAGLLALSLIVQGLLFLTTVVLSVVAAYGILFLVRRTWELELLRKWLKVLLFCLGLFLVLVSVQERVREYPTREFTNALVFLSQTESQGKVLTLPDYAPMVEYFSHHQATLLPGEDTELFRSRDAGRLYDFLERTGTSYVLITDEMINSFFTRSDQGILFLLPNAQRFILAHETSKTSVWYYIPRRDTT